MPADPNLVHRTDAKLSYARLHLNELREYSNLGHADNWERAHTESILFHLVGVKDAFLHEINFAYSLDVDVDQINERRLAFELKKRRRPSIALERICDLRNDGRSWLYRLVELRNQGSHRFHIHRTIKIGVGGATGRLTRLRDPRSDMEIEKDPLELLQEFCDKMEELVTEMRKLLP